MGAYTGLPFIIFSAISATPTGAYEVVLSGQTGLKIITSGTSATPTITFSAKLNETDTATSIMASNLTTGTSMVSTAKVGEIFYFSNLEGLYSVLINVTAVPSGNVTIKGKLY